VSDWYRSSDRVSRTATSTLRIRTLIPRDGSSRSTDACLRLDAATRREATSSSPVCAISRTLSEPAIFRRRSSSKDVGASEVRCRSSSQTRRHFDDDQNDGRRSSNKMVRMSSQYTSLSDWYGSSRRLTRDELTLQLRRSAASERFVAFADTEYIALSSPLASNDKVARMAMASSDTAREAVLSDVIPVASTSPPSRTDLDPQS